MKMKHITTLLIVLSLAFNTAAQETGEAEIQKKGLSFGAFPILGYEQDQGFQLGVLGNLYDFGKKSEYPNPRQQLYVEASWFMRGSQRYALSYDNRFLIPGSVVLGAFFLTACDIISRALDVQAEVPVGVVTSFIGAPIFLYLIIRQKSGVW